jgi:protein-glutamine gamma-glutamyltransferase
MKNTRLGVEMLVAAMLMLNGILLALSRGEIWPLGLLIILPIPLWYVTDLKKWYELPAWAANTIGLGIGGYAMYFFGYQATERHLAVVSDMVCYLLLTMLLQRKTPRLYWQIAVLSVLQSVVASVFSLNLQQGALFILYTFLVLSALSMIALQRDQLLSTANSSLGAGRSSTGMRWRTKRPDVRIRPTRPEWSPERLRVLVIAIAGIAVVSVAAGMSVYVSLPRLEDEQNAGGLRLRTTGVTRQIESLEPSGVLQPNSTEALRVKLIDPSTTKSIRLQGDMYLRGACLEVLKSEATGWRINTSGPRPTRMMAFPATPSKIFRQEIVMIPREDPMLFYCTPVTPAFNAARDLMFDNTSESLFRYSPENIVAATPFRYELGLYGVEERVQPIYTPFLNLQHLSYDRPLNEDFRVRFDQLTQCFPERYPALRAKAKEIESRVPNGWRDRQAVCRALEDYLATSPDFRYTTDFRGIQRRRELDPVEDFVANYRQGHCELFASALCLMLRSLDIPARVVVGYRTAKYNEVAGVYSVQEKHAHSWVEAYLAPRHCTPEMLERRVAGKDGGAWMRLDPTPAADTLEEEGTNFLSQANDALGYAQSLWDEYVMGIQNGTPDANRAAMSRMQVLQTMLDPSAAADWARRQFTQLSNEQRAGLASLIVLALFLLQWRSGQTRKKHAGTNLPRGTSLWKRWFGRADSEAYLAAADHWADEALRRLESMAVRAGYRPRKPSMTPREFAEQVVLEAKNVATSLAVPTAVDSGCPAHPGDQDRGNDPSLPPSQLEVQMQRWIKDFYRVKYSAELPDGRIPKSLPPNESKSPGQGENARPEASVRQRREELFRGVEQIRPLLPAQQVNETSK